MERNVAQPPSAHVSICPQNMVIYVEPIFSIHKLRKQLRQGYRGKKYRDATTFERYQSLKHNF
jgi:hypothetical protein